MTSDATARVSELLHEVAETHHVVYRITDGDDPDWASFYADWLARPLGAAGDPGRAAGAQPPRSRARAARPGLRRGRSRQAAGRTGTPSGSSSSSTAPADRPATGVPSRPWRPRGSRPSPTACSRSRRRCSSSTSRFGARATSSVTRSCTRGREYAAYGVSFITIGIMWINHHDCMRQIGAVDRTFLIDQPAAADVHRVRPVPDEADRRALPRRRPARGGPHLRGHAHDHRDLLRQLLVLCRPRHRRLLAEDADPRVISGISRVVPARRADLRRRDARRALEPEGRGGPVRRDRRLLSARELGLRARSRAA